MKSKANPERRILISIAATLLLIITIFGITYAYFLSNVQGNINNNSLKVTAGKLEITYIDGDDSIVVDDLEPGTLLKSKTFSVKNTGTEDIKSYEVYLEDFTIKYASDATLLDGVTKVKAGDTTNLAHAEDMKMTIKCTSDVSGKSCNGMDGTLPVPEIDGNNILFSNSISVGETQSYVLTLEFVDDRTNQSIDMNKKISARINIMDETPEYQEQ